MKAIICFVVQVHPGTPVYATNRFTSWSSLAPMWHQVEAFGSDLMNISKAHPEGIHLIGTYFKLASSTTKQLKKLIN